MDSYIEYLTALGRSEKTIKIYTRAVRRALDLAAERDVDLLDVRPSEMRALSAEWRNSWSIRSQLRSALMHYWNMHEVAGPSGAINVPSQPSARWKGLEDEETKRLLAVARVAWPRGGVVYLGLYLGLRRGEIAALRWDCFDENLGWATITGKGDRTRYLPVHPRLREMLAAHRWPNEYVFPGRQAGSHITPTTVSNWVAELGVEAGIGKLHPHQLRHTAGGKINDQTHDIYTTQAFLGHARIQTTLTYTRLKTDRLRRAIHELDWEDAEYPTAA